MRVKDLMTKDVRFCHPSTTLQEAVGMMKERDCGSLPVVSEGDQLEVAGVITDRDIALSAFEHGKALAEIRVDDAMSTEPVSCAPDDEIAAAERLMSDAHVRRLPVMDDGRLAGMISLAQIARRAADGSAKIDESEVGETLAAICEPTAGSRTAVS